MIRLLRNLNRKKDRKKRRRIRELKKAVLNRRLLMKDLGRIVSVSIRINIDVLLM